MIRSSAILLVSLAAAMALSCASAPAPQGPAIFLVRHAETEGEGSDPGLSPAGRARAERIADLLAAESIERILTTSYRRTRETAAPLAARLGIEPEIYDPRALEELATALRRDGRRVLVVGHSNTTPPLVDALGGDAGSPIQESEYDRIYRVDLPSGNTTMTRS